VKNPLTKDRARAVAIAIGALRTGAGAVILVVPSLARLWVGPGGASTSSQVLSRSLAARDLSLGAGALLARDDPRRLRQWVAAAAFCDSADAVGTWAAFSHLPRRARAPIAITSGMAALSGAAAAFSLGGRRLHRARRGN
jgi:hypothetical protein